MRFTLSNFPPVNDSLSLSSLASGELNVLRHRRDSFSLSFEASLSSSLSFDVSFSSSIACDVSLRSSLSVDVSPSSSC